MKGKFKFANFKNCLEETQYENKTNHLEKHKIDVDSFFYSYKRKQKEFIKNKRLILQIQQRFNIFMFFNTFL